MNSNLAKVAGSLIDLKPIKIEAPKILARPSQNLNSASISKQDLPNTKDCDQSQSYFSTIKGQSSQRSFASKPDGYSTLPRLVLTSICASDQEMVTLQEPSVLQDNQVELSIQKVMTFGGENYNPNLNCKSTKNNLDLADLHYDFLESSLQQRSTGSQTKDASKHASYQPKKSKSSPKQSKKRKKSSQKQVKEKGVKDSNFIEEKPIKLQKQSDRPKSQRPPNLQSQLLIQKSARPVQTIKEVEKEQLGSSAQPKRRLSPANKSLEPNSLNQISQLIQIEQSEYTTITSAGEFKLPRLNISSEYTTLKTDEKQHEEQVNDSGAPSPEKLTHSPIKVQLQQSLANQINSFASATTRLETARISNFTNSHSELPIKEFCINDPQIKMDSASFDNLTKYSSEQEAEKLANMFYCSKKVTQAMQSWQMHTKNQKQQRVIEQSQYNSAEQLHRFQIKQKVFNQMRLRSTRTRQLHQMLIDITERKQEKTIRIAMDRFVDATLVLRACQSRSIKLKLAAFRSLLSHQKRQHCKQQISQLYNRSLLSKSLASMMAYRDKCLAYQRLKVTAETYQSQTKQQQVRGIFQALFGYSSEKKRNTQMSCIYKQSIKYKCIRALANNVGKVQQKREYQKLVQGFSRCRLAISAIRLIQQGIKNQISQRDLLQNQWQQEKKRKLLNYLRFIPLQSKVQKCASTKLAWAAQIWLDFSLSSVMDRVWSDFPRQKLTKLDGKPTMILNYLRLDKRKRYREFFVQVNTKLRLDLVAKVFDHLFIYCARLRQLKKRNQYRRLLDYFENFATVCLQQKSARLTILRHLKIRSQYRLNQIFSALRQVTQLKRKLRLKSDLISNLHSYNSAKDHFAHWLHLKQKLDYLAKQDQVSTMILRSKIYSIYMQKWLHALHLKLRKRNIQEKGDQIVRRRQIKFYFKWRYVFQRQCVKDDEFRKKIMVKQSNLANLILNRWCLFVKAQKCKQQKILIAQQQYIYQLGRRVFGQFKIFKNQNQAKQNLYDSLATQIRTKCISSVLNNLRSYCNYRKAKIYYSQKKSKSVKGLIKAKILSKWLKCYNRRKAIKLLFEDLSQIQKKITLVKLINFSREQSINVHSMQMFKLGQVLQCLNALVKRNKILQQLETVFQQARQKRIFNNWIQKIMKKKIIAKIFIKANQNNLKRTMVLSVQALKSNVILQRKVDRFIIDHANLKLQHIWNFMRHSQLKRQKSKLLMTKTVEIRSNRVRQTTFRKWKGLYLKNKKIYDTLSKQKLARLGKVFTEFRRISQRYCQTRSALKRARHQWQMRQVCEFLQKLHTLSSQRLLKQAQIKRAACHYRIKILGQAVTQMKKIRSATTPALCKVRTRKRKTLIFTFMNRWLNRSEKALKKIRALKRMHLITLNARLKLVMTDWNAEARLITQLKFRTLELYQRLTRNQIKRALRQLHKTSQHQIQCRNGQEKSQNHQQTQIYAKVVRALRDFTKISKIRTLRLQSANSRKSYQLLKMAFVKLQSYCTKKRAEKIQLNKLKMKQRKLVLPHFIFQWHLRTQEKQHKNNVQLIAQKKHNQIVLMRCLRKICEYTILRQRRREVIHQVFGVYQRNLAQKVFNELYLNCEYRHELRLKRASLFQVVQKIDQKYILSKSLGAIINHQQTIKFIRAKAVLDAQRRIMSRAFSGLKEWTCDRDILKSAFSIINGQSTRQTQLMFFKEWHLNFLQVRAIKHAQNEYKVKLQRRCFYALVSNMQNLRRQNFIQQKYLVVLAVKALQSFKQHTRYRIQRKTDSVKAYQKLMKSLYIKGLKAFCLNVVRYHNLRAFQHKMQTSTARRVLLRWDRQLQLKLMQSDAFSNCISILTRRYFNEWTQYCKDVQIIQELDRVRQLRKKFEVVKSMFKVTQLHKQLKSILEKKENQRIKTTFKQWRIMTKFRIQKFVDSLSPAVAKIMQNVFNQIVNFNDHQKRVFDKQDPYAKLIPKQTAPPRTNLWLNQLLVKDTLKSLDCLYNKQQQRIAFKQMILNKNALKTVEMQIFKLKNKLSKFPTAKGLLNCMFSQYIIVKDTFFDSQNLVYTFAAFRQECQKQRKKRVCENIFSMEQQRKDKNLKLDYFYQWIEAFRLKRQKNCVSAYLSQSYCDRFVKKVFMALLENKQKGVQKLKLQSRVFLISTTRQRCVKLIRVWHSITQRRQLVFERVMQFRSQKITYTLKSAFSAMQYHTQLNQVLSHLYNQTQIKRNREFTQKVFILLQQNVNSQKIKRLNCVKAQEHNSIRLAKKVLVSLKLNKVLERQAACYSRKFAVFTAWKALSREQRLLSQYLSECNYQGSSSSKAY